MTAKAQIALIKWVAATFGGSIVGLIIWGATLTSEVKQLRGEVNDFWMKYNKAEDEKAIMIGEFAKYRQKVDDMEKHIDKESENDLIKKLFEHHK